MVTVGRIARAHGNRGRVIVDPDTDFAVERFRPGNALHVRRGGRLVTLLIRDVRFHRQRPILGLEGVETMSDAEALAAAELRIPEETLEPLPAGSYYHHELIGCRVETLSGAIVGTVQAVEGNAGVNRLVVNDGAGEQQVPLVAPICVKVDPAARLITIDPPQGLLGLNAPARVPRADSVAAGRPVRKADREDRTEI